MKTKIQGLYKTFSSPVIIKLLFPALLFLFSFRSWEGTGKSKLPVIRKEVKVDNTFQNVSVNGDLTMILTNEPAGTFVMEGNEEAVNNLRYKVKDNELIINVHRKNRLDKLTIYLSAATLKSMLINGDADISSMDIIKSDNLQIWMNGIVNLKVKTTGKVNVDASDAYELLWESPLHNIK